MAKQFMSSLFYDRGNWWLPFSCLGFRITLADVYFRYSQACKAEFICLADCILKRYIHEWSAIPVPSYAINILAVLRWKSYSPPSMHAASLILPRRAVFTKPSK